MALQIPGEPQNPLIDEYGRSASQNSLASYQNLSFLHRFSSATSSSNLLAHEDDGSEPEGDELQRRGSSISMRIRHTGGPNSFENFARSWQRAAGFSEIVPRRSSFAFAQPDDGDGREHGGSLGEQHVPKERRSLFWRQLEIRGSLQEATLAETNFRSDGGNGEGSSKKNPPGGSLHDIFSQTVSPLGRSFGTSYGTISSSRMTESARKHAAQLHREQQLTEICDYGDEHDPVLIRQIQHEDGTKETVIIGQSTVPQTIFNSVNILIGIGLLSLPLGLRYSGWLIGTLFLLFSAVTTSYTARILAKCMDADPNLVTYADLAYVSFGPQARLLTSLLFCLELIGTCVALDVLFADSLDALIPGYGVIQWKLLCGIILIPLNFVPLRFLSVSSILGILCCTSIVGIVIVDGFIKAHSPGSLRRPAQTYFFPHSWSTVPLSFGLIMSPWGGHSVFPNIYRDMRHPQRYEKSLWVTYIFTFSLDLAMAVVGWLMFGDLVGDEITSNILVTIGYPHWLSVCLVVFIAIVPLTKTPLNCRPIVGTIEVLCGLNSRAISPISPAHGMNELLRSTLRGAIRIFTIAVITFIAIVFPFFDRIMALIGSSLCFTICVILPLAFYLKIFGAEISLKERIVDYVLLAISSVMAVVGTIWAFAPQEKLGRK